uniref:Phosphatidate cytidylyltransferase, mitochondrial n=1 Tax=Eptatretus burgeri TaxID=7764 RepID=A0A8C4QID9_EPTBU
MSSLTSFSFLFKKNFLNYFRVHEFNRGSCSVFRAVSSVMCASRVSLGLLRRVLSCFPGDVSLSLAYGSGVLAQRGSKSGNNILDFLLAVNEPTSWHVQNLKMNPRHYSCVRIMGPQWIAKIQLNYGASVYFNTLVPCEGRLMKYGVISTEDLLDDLLHWKTLYVSGRLHKPVRILRQQDGEGRLHTALQVNLRSAMTAALLTLPESFSEEQLFTTIAGLSYTGDFRMVVGEDRSKVENIVHPNLEEFRRLYAQFLHESPYVVYQPSQGRLELDKSADTQFTQLLALPTHLQQQLTNLVDPPGRNRDVEEVLLQISQDPECGLWVRKGPVKAIRYSAQKVKKMWKGFLTSRR